MLRDEEGFTLLELLVAVALIALMAVPVTESLRKGIQSWNLSHERADDSEKRLLMRQRIKVWISSAYPADPLRAGGAAVPPLVGSADQLRFLGVIHPDVRSDDLYAVTLSLNDSQELVTSIKSDFDRGEDVFLETALISGVNAITFSYLNSDEGQPANWAETWQGQNKLPRAVKLSVDFVDDSVFWPDLIIPLEVKEWAHCAYDPVALACRSGGGSG